MENCGKTIYAYEKVREAVREHEDHVTVALPKTRAKVVVLGNSGVGKTCTIYRHRFGDGIAPFAATIGASFVTCDIESDNEDVQLQIWDTAGQERFRCMVPMYMRNATAAIIMYDITNRQSFNDIDKWASELQRCCGMSDPILVLIGNKADLDDKRQVARGEGVNKALQMNARFYEMTGNNPEAFSQVLSDLAGDLIAGGFGWELSEKPNTTIISPLSEEIPVMKVVSSSKCCFLN